MASPRARHPLRMSRSRHGTSPKPTRTIARSRDCAAPSAVSSGGRTKPASPSTGSDSRSSKGRSSACSARMARARPRPSRCSPDCCIHRTVSSAVLGYRPFDRDTAYLRRIALVMGQKSMLWWDVPAMESLLLHKEMYGLADTDFRESVDELATLLDVGDLLQVPVRKLSLGRADEDGTGRGPVASPGSALPRRADDRARCGRQGAGPRASWPRSTGSAAPRS